jgi:anti-sigma regulatory factor (Ser/Thr protein kinase)
MAGILPRRQAARLGELLGRRFLPGLAVVEARRPRLGKSDLLLQLRGELLGRRPIALILLRLAHGPLAADAGEQAAAQLWRALQRVPPVVAASEPATTGLFHAGRLAEREDAALWKRLLSADAALRPQRFFAALGELAGSIGPVLLLLDDANPAMLAVAESAAADSAALAVLASVPNRRQVSGARCIALEELTVREGVLLAEGLARQLDVKFCGRAAEEFAAYCRSDPFALSSVVYAAANGGEPLDSPLAFVRAYINDLCHGTLAAYFRAAVPGEPGTLERQFVLHWLAPRPRSSPRRRLGTCLEAWRERVAVDELLARMGERGLAAAGRSGWEPPCWRAACDWAALEGAPAPAAEREAAGLTMRLLCDMEAAAREHAGLALGQRIASGLASAAPLPAFPSRLRFREVCRVAQERLPGGHAFFCYGFTGPQRTADSAALLAVARLEGPGRLGSALDEIDARVAAAAPFTEWHIPPMEAGARCEKWIIVTTPVPEDVELAERRGFRIFDDEGLNRMLAPPAGGGPEPCWQVVLRIPAQPDSEIAAVRVLDHLLERAGCGAPVAAQARTALIEACLNAFEHARTALAAGDGTAAGAAGHVEVRLYVSPGRLEMAVANAGAPFEPGSEPESGASLRRGHGLKIIRAMMDDAVFTSDLSGTTIRMWKRFSAPAAGAEAEAPENENAAP